MTDAPTIHLKCLRTNRLYRVVGWDLEADTVTLRGENGEFTEPFGGNGARFKEIGYQRIVGDIDGAIPVE